jgi:uncharacterized protein (TIGR00730 family)
MADLADAFISMPGGWGTLDETAEILTWKQLGLISQPLGILNINGFFDNLLQQMTVMVQDGFLNHKILNQIVVASSPELLLKDLIPQ